MKGEVDFVVEATAEDSICLTSWHGGVAESRPPFDFDFFGQGDVDVFARNGFSAQGGV